MKIVLFSQALTPQYGGSAFSEASLAGSLQAKAGHSVQVLCRLGCFDLDFVQRFGAVAVQGYRAVDWMWAWLNRNHPLRAVIRNADLVHLNGHWRWENYLVARICAKERRPFVLQPRGMLWLGHRSIWKKKVFQFFLGRYIVRNAASLIALSRFEVSHWDAYGLPDEQVVVLPNGVLGVETENTKRAENLPQKNRPYFLYLGRLESRKNLVFLIQCYHTYRRRGGEAELWLVGPVERKYDAVLRRAILQMGVVSHVRIFPPVFSQGKRELMAGSLAVVYPAIEEPFGRVPFEALEAGARPIVPQRSGSAEYIRPFLREMIYQDGDSKSLLAVLAQAEKPSHAQNSQLKKACDWVRRELHWERVVRRYDDLYRTILARNEKSSRAS